jgi:hypothetical protein
MPSWVANYHEIDRSNLYLLPINHLFSDIPWLVDTPNAKISGLELSVFGFQIATIKHVNTDSIYAMFYDDRMRDICAKYADISTSGQGIKPLELICRFCFLNEDQNSDLDYFENTLQFCSWLFLKPAAEESTLITRINRFGMLEPRDFSSWYINHFGFKYCDEMAKVKGLPELSHLQERHIATFLKRLERGRHSMMETDLKFFVHGPMCTKPGDIVTVFKDSPAPSILRKIDHRYVHIGICHISDFMNETTGLSFRHAKPNIKEFVIM